MSLNIQETANQYCCDLSGMRKFFVRLFTTYPRIRTDEFTKLAVSLTDFYNQDLKKFEGFVECRIDYQYYKQSLTIATILSEPILHKPFETFMSYCLNNGVPAFEFESMFPAINPPLIPRPHISYFYQLQGECICEHNILLILKNLPNPPAWIDKALDHSNNVLIKVFGLMPAAGPWRKAQARDFTNVFRKWNQWYHGYKDQKQGPSLHPLHRSPRLENLTKLVQDYEKTILQIFGKDSFMSCTSHLDDEQKQYVNLQTKTVDAKSVSA